MTSMDAILQVRDLHKIFPVEGGRRLVAVDCVNLDVAAGETLALVGESGSGKSTVARCIVRLIEPSSGDVTIDGTSIVPLPAKRLAGVYRRIQMVFQDPNASLNPRMNVRQVLDEPLRLHLEMSRVERTEVRELVEMVGLTAAHPTAIPTNWWWAAPAWASRAPSRVAGYRHPRRADLVARCLGARPDPRPLARAAARCAWPISSSATTYRSCSMFPTALR
jgi:ABC-type glutathione transport system ATPase component